MKPDSASFFGSSLTRENQFQDPAQFRAWFRENNRPESFHVREVPLAALESAADEIEQTIQNTLDREISTERIGDLVMERLKPLDEVAYVRFASVYRQFKDIDSFMQELNKILQER